MSAIDKQSSFIRAILARLEPWTEGQCVSLTKLNVSLAPFKLELTQHAEASDVIGKMSRAFAQVDLTPSSSTPFRLSCVLGCEPLGLPPTEWPFDVNNRDSFQRVYWQAVEAMTADETVGLWNLADFSGERYLTWMRDEKSLPSWEFAAPFRHHLHWQALRQGAGLVHAAGWAVDNGAILLTGPGGSGKSTTSLTAAIMGRPLFAEDLAWVDLSNKQAHIVPLYKTLKITFAAQERFGMIRDYVASQPHETYDKTLLWSDGIAPSPRRLSAMYCLSGQFTEHTEIKPCSASIAFRLLAPSTLFLMRTAQTITLNYLRRLVDVLPCYHVSLGSDPYEVVTAIERHANAAEGHHLHPTVLHG